MNILAAVYADLTGRPRPVLAARPRPVSWVHPKDVCAARDSGVGLHRRSAFAARCQTKAFWSWRDPMPFSGMAAARARTGDLT